MVADVGLGRSGQPERSRSRVPRAPEDFTGRRAEAEQVAACLTEPGYVRTVVLHVERLDDIQNDLLVSGVRMHGDEAVVMYQFSVRDAARALLTGRATIVLDAATLRHGGAATPKP